MSIRTSLLLALCVLASAGPGMSAAVHAQGVEGTDYRKIGPPQPTDSPGKIEVIEFFSYMCPHCNEFYPLVSIWEAKLPRNVVFRRVPGDGQESGRDAPHHRPAACPGANRGSRRGRHRETQVAQGPAGSRVSSSSSLASGTRSPRAK